MIRRNGDVIEMAFEVPPMRGVLRLFFNAMTEEDDIRELLDGKMVVFEGPYTMMITKPGTIEIAGPEIAFSAKVDVDAMKTALGSKVEN